MCYIIYTDVGVGKSTLLLQMAGSVASLAKRSLQYQGIGMGPPLPSPTISASSTVASSDSATKNSTVESVNQISLGGGFGGVSGGGNNGPVIYISGEENANQIAYRALRLGIQDPELLLWCETDADAIANAVVNSMHYGADGDPSSFPSFSSCEDDNNMRGSSPPPLSRLPSLIVIDSIQTMVCDAAGASSVGGITQVRECVGLFLRLAKSTGVPIMLVGHVTKVCPYQHGVCLDTFFPIERTDQCLHNFSHSTIFGASREMWQDHAQSSIWWIAFYIWRGVLCWERVVAVAVVTSAVEMEEGGFHH